MSERAYQWRDIPHLAQRTLWSLRRPEPDPAGEAWLLTKLTPAETLLYRSMPIVDRAHAIASGRAVDHLGDEVIVASALHDVGKIEAGLGTPGRVLASLCGLLIPDQAQSWDGMAGWRGQIGRYLDHSDRGAKALEDAGASWLAIAWAREHHLGESERTIDPDLAAALAQADE